MSDSGKTVANVKSKDKLKKQLSPLERCAVIVSRGSISRIIIIAYIAKTYTFTECAKRLPLQANKKMCTGLVCMHTT